MKSIGITLQAPILQKTANRTIVRNPAKLSDILGMICLCIINFAYVVCK